ncbi:MAG: TfoX/Sxy family protein [Rhodospirillales bacterium]|jgi:DNA transformation protein|nr:TfoX/Sxy family protein [Rhodospirillales bacterium]
MFGLIAADELYLKAGDSNRDALLAMGGKPFKPFDDKPMIMSYMSVPADILDDAERLCELARQSLIVAGKAPARRLAKPRSRKEA